MQAVEEAVSMGKSMGLDIDGVGIKELVQDCKSGMRPEELGKLQSEQKKMLGEERSREERKTGRMSIKSIMEKQRASISMQSTTST